MAHVPVAFEKRAVIVAGDAFAIFVLIAESDDAGPVMKDAVFGLGNTERRAS